jgi:hypothetical protein
MWAAIVNALPTIAAAASVAGAAYGVAASADAARRNANALKRAENAANTEMEARLKALQSLDGGTSATDLANVAQKESFNKAWIYGGAVVIGLGALWFVVRKKGK